LKKGEPFKGVVHRTEGGKGGNANKRGDCLEERGGGVFEFSVGEIACVSSPEKGGSVGVRGGERKGSDRR